MGIVASQYQSSAVGAASLPSSTCGQIWVPAPATPAQSLLAALPMVFLARATSSSWGSLQFPISPFLVSPGVSSSPSGWGRQERMEGMYPRIA